MQLLGVLTVIALIHVIHVTKSEHSINFTVGNDSMTLSIKQDEDAVQKAVEYCRDIFNTDTLKCIIKIGTRLAASMNQSIDFGSNIRMPSDRVICDKNVHGKRFENKTIVPSNYEKEARLNIIYTYASKTDLPLEIDEVKRRNNKLMENHSNFMFFDDEDIGRFVGHVYPHYLDVFNSFSHKILQLDFFRYLAVYYFGGLYMDMDVLLTVPFGCDSIDTSKAIFPIEQRCGSGSKYECSPSTKLSSTLDIGDNKGRIHIAQYAFYAPREHPFLGAIIDSIVRTQRASIGDDAISSSDPEFVSRIIETTGNAVVTKVYSTFEPKSSIELIEPNPFRFDAFGKYGWHMSFGSWKGWVI
jgi:hypothetical protein